MKKILIGLAMLTTIGCNSNIKNVKIGDTVFYRNENSDLACVAKVINITQRTVVVTDNKFMYVYMLHDFNYMYGGKAVNMKLNINPRLSSDKWTLDVVDMSERIEEIIKNEKAINRQVK